MGKSSPVLRAIVPSLAAIAAIALAGCSSSDDNEYTVPGFSVITPSGGENLVGASAYTVNWTSSGWIKETVDIEISTDKGVSWKALVKGTDNDGSETVLLPNTNTEMLRSDGTVYFNASGKKVLEARAMIRIKGDSLAIGVSRPFIITKPGHSSSYTTAVANPPKNVILIIGDGMQLSHEIAYARYQEGDSTPSWMATADYEAPCTTWDVTTYNRFASKGAVANFYDDVFQAKIGYDVSKGGAERVPNQVFATAQDLANADSYFLSTVYGPTYSTISRYALTASAAIGAGSVSLKSNMGVIALADGDSLILDGVKYTVNGDYVISSTAVTVTLDTALTAAVTTSSKVVVPAISNDVYLTTTPNMDSKAIPATDSASAGTGLACGRKTDDGNLAWAAGDGEGGKLLTIAELVKKQNSAKIGVVTTVPISHATPAAFVAHNTNRNNYTAISSEIIGTVKPDVVIGAGSPVGLGEGAGNIYSYVGATEHSALAAGTNADYIFAEWANGTDGNTSLTTATDTVVANITANSGKKKLFALYGESEGYFERSRVAQNSLGTPTYAAADGHPIESPDLGTCTTQALRVLNAGTTADGNTKGFFLMVEQGDIDWANHASDYPWMLGAMHDLDLAVQAAVSYVNTPGDAVDWGNTLLIVTSDHGNSYMRIDPSKLTKGKVPTFTTRTYGSFVQDVATDGSVWYSAPTYTRMNFHTNELTSLYMKGNVAELIGDKYDRLWYTSGKKAIDLYDNTLIFFTMCDALGVQPPYGPLMPVSGSSN